MCVWAGWWHVPLEEGIDHQNTAVWVLSLPRVKNKNSPSLWRRKVDLAGRSRKLKV